MRNKFWMVVASLAFMVAAGCSDDNTVEPAPVDTVASDDAGEIEGSETVGGTKEGGGSGVEADATPVGGCPPNSIGGIASADPSFSTLMTAVELVGLAGTLCNEGDFTVFAPTNDAFNALEDGVLEALLADTEQLEAVLLSTTWWMGELVQRR